MTVERLNTLEERIEKPGYLLLVVIVLLFLIVGFVDVIDHFADNPVILGRYDLPHVFIIAAYAVILVAWASLLRHPNNDRWLVRTLDFVQQRSWLALLLLAGIVAVFAVLLIPTSPLHKRFLFFPALQATVMVTALLAAGLILFYKWGDPDRPQTWRKIVVGMLIFLIIVEIIFQILAMFGLMPSLSTTRDGFSPYTRVYQADEGLGSGVTNQYGRYAPGFRLFPSQERIAVIGGPMVQALQVDKDQNVGVQLGERLAERSGEDNIEVLNVGYPDYGPGMYLSNWMVNVLARDFEPDEVIILFDLGSDFQEVDGPGYDLPYFDYVGQGRVQLDLQNFFTDLHNAEHVVYRGNEGFQLTRTLGSFYLTPRFVAQWLGLSPDTAAKPHETPRNAAIDRANGFVFDDETNDEALRIAYAQINMANDQLERGGIATRLVTIPAFTAQFYAQDTWNTRFGASDLLLPEEALRASANDYGIPFLGLGTYMAAQGKTPQEVHALYFNHGLGHFTPEGHAFVAQAIYECFYEQSLTPEQGCDLQHW